MSCSLNGYGATTQFALVGFIPEPLGSFLTDLRTELVSGCRLRSHVTVLPPRYLSSPVGALVSDLRVDTKHIHAFEIELGEIQIFPVTNVIYLSLKSGKEHIEAMHARLSRNLFAYQEPYPFHPHVTLAQEVPQEYVADVYARACQRWMDWGRSRKFKVDSLVFVRNVNMMGWENLSEHALANGAMALRTA